MGLIDLLRPHRKSRDAAHALYAQAVAQARTPGFYAELGVPDTLDGRFDLLVLHVFLLLRRLRRGGVEAERVAQALFDLMFRDMDRTLRELGVSDHSVGKRVKQMLAAFYGRTRAYEEALDVPARLAETLHRNVYRESDAVPESVAQLAGYAAEQGARLQALEIAVLARGESGFLAPDFTRQGAETR